MENLFIANSKFNLEKLKENKAFLLDLVRQIKEAYIIKYYNEEDIGDKTEIAIGNCSRGYETHKFSVDGKGIITFEGTFVKLPNDIAAQLMKKYPTSRIQPHAHHSWVQVNITDISKKTIGKVIKDIVLIFETGGQNPAFTLRR